MVRPRKLSSLPILSALSPSSVMLKLPTGSGATGAAPGVISCVPAPRITPVRLRVAAVPGVARRVDEPLAPGLGGDRGPAVVTAVGVGLGGPHPAAAGQLGHRPVEAAGHRGQG